MTTSNQLELPLVLESGKVSKDACPLAIANMDWDKIPAVKLKEVRANVIPGLDASLCRCDRCTKNTGGTWWIDLPLRERILKKVTAFPILNREAESHTV